MKFKATFAALSLMFAISTAHADTHVGRTALVAGDDGTTPADTFKPDTPKLVLHGEILEPKAGAKFTGTWVAVKTQAAAPNYVIDSASFVTEKDQGEFTLGLSKPDSGWPVGDYRIDVLIDGKPAMSVPFHIAQ